MRGHSGFTDEQERQVTDLVKHMATALFGPAGPSTEEDRSSLYRRVAAAMRREPECKATARQVRAVAQRIRTRREERLHYPIDLSPEDYAYVARLREESGGGTLKATLGGIIAAYRAGA